MASAMYIGVSGKAQKISNMYIGVNGVAQKIKNAYIGVNGVAQLIYSAESVFTSYSGTYTAPTSTTTIDGAKYKIYTLKKSGTLVFEGTALYWMCGGGGGGGTASSSGSGGGGGGGYFKTGTLNGGSYVVTIGSGGGTDTNGGTTKIGSLSVGGGKCGGGAQYQATLPNGIVYYPHTAGVGGDGASGGGGGGNNSTAHTAGLGGGESTYPFGLTDLYAHSAGGAAGHFRTNQVEDWKGGKGGSNGSDGFASTAAEIGVNTGTSNGGEKGGGTGGAGTTTNGYGRNATYYGSGGGGAGAMYSFDSTEDQEGGTGYSGVVYIAIPVAA